MPDDTGLYLSLRSESKISLKSINLGISWLLHVGELYEESSNLGASAPKGGVQPFHPQIKKKQKLL
jgi:hypothetical protein